MAPASLIPEPDEALLRGLALRAMDAARAAGASFADIRITAARCVEVGFIYRKGMEPRMAPLFLDFPVGYGIRAIVDGAWGDAAGVDATPDAVVATARTAVAIAKGNRPRRPRVLELAPADTVPNGTWATPIKQEPLDVPLGEQAELALAAVAEAAKVPEATYAAASFQWRRPTSVLATTQGTTITFRYATAILDAGINVAIGPEVADEGWGGVEGLPSGPYGYESLNGRALVAGMRLAAERALTRVKASRRAASVDVGRYDLVLSADAVSALLASTIAEALNAKRALGYEANRAGTSFAAPPSEILGAYQVASPLVTITGDRVRPGGAATVGWDEEGVRPQAYTCVERGIITDYHTTRDTAPQLGEWYRRRGEPVRAHGVARRCGADLPSICLPNLTLAPGPDAATAEDLIKDVKKGLYIERAMGTADQQLLNSQFSAQRADVRYITNGRLGAYAKDVAFQFVTPQFWKRLDALGGAASSQAMPVVTDGVAVRDRLQPFPFSTFEVVPARVRGVNVLNTGRSA